MSIQTLEDFVAQLKTVPVVMTEVGDNIFPTVKLDSTSPSSFIVYNPRGGEAEPYYTGQFGQAIYRIQIDIYTVSFTKNQTIYDGIYEIFNGFSGELNNNTYIGRTELLSYTNTYSKSDGEYFRTTFDIELTL